jgi:hypothetical protein
MNIKIESETRASFYSLLTVLEQREGSGKEKRKIE